MNLQMNRQRAASIALVFFFVLLVVLTLFSNTLQSFNLPKVTTEKPAQKTLYHIIKGSGITSAKHQMELTGESGWKVRQVHVEEGDIVEEGQVLVSFYNDDAEAALLDMEAQLKKRQLQREALQEQFVAASQAGDEAAVRKAKRDIEIDSLDMEVAERQLVRMREELKAQRELTAPFRGRVSLLQAREGVAIPQGQSALTLSAIEEGYQFSFQVSEAQAELLEIGEEVKVTVSGAKEWQLQGAITSITETTTDRSGGGGGLNGGDTDNAGSPRTIVIDLSDSEIAGGERASVSLQKQAKEQGVVIPKSLLRQDGKGSYLFVVRERTSALGNTYTAQKAYVTTGDENDDEIVVLGGLFPQDDVISDMSEPLQDGNQIRFK
ncbi:HlyD family efflux transporter periplasmic adaptor subunit [Paenibacillus sp. J5C_2022]|uniref:efflux RND transporter periplasmic adaptor subunit n=1 Tax=Paenibacillus sp. J5C2022 TaxID=2977129 RepID=UPI0021D0AE98|nr:HlyD family efflux transporter periplasmic adaptor subunit [Paenibacillus sp. J5C2022]MCU6707449.1 HlyD family efflux transporter periplasmic adaptor subunit [Paenibacillus sp. J5C2022]